jgi:hypothetical protein
MPDPQATEYPVSREKLYELAWSQPMTSIAKLFDVSSSYLARVYASLDVPRPAPGYWAKVAAGKKTFKPKLPDATPDNPGEWDRYNDTVLNKKEFAPKPPEKIRKVRSSNQRARPKTHQLLQGAKAHFLKTRDSDIGYLRPYKQILVDLIISKTSLNVALDIANKLFLAFEDYDYKVRLEPAGSYFQRPEVDERSKPGKGYRHIKHWSPCRGTIIYVGTVAIGLTLFEVSEQKEMRYVDGEYVPVEKLKGSRSRYDHYSWTTRKDYPTGNFCLRAYSPYQGTSWEHRWQISANADITKLGHKIARELAGQAAVIAAEAKKAEEEAEKQRIEWEEQRRQWEIEAAKRRHDDAVNQSHKDLLEIISNWVEIKRIHEFFEQLEIQVSELADDRKQEIVERIRLAKQLIGSPDALEGILKWATPDERLNAID